MAGVYDSFLVEAMQQGLISQLEGWGLSCETEVTLLTVSENATFKAVDPVTGQRTVLRVHRPGYHTDQEIRSELAWIQAIQAASEIRTPPIIPRRDGSLVGKFECRGETRSAVAFGFVKGIEPIIDRQLSERFQTLGHISAQLHHHSRHWKPPPDFKRPRWDFTSTLGSQPRWGDWRNAIGLTPDGRSLLEECCSLLELRLAAFGTDPDRFGLIHADLRLANLLVDADQLTVIDFDDCGYGWYLYEFAAALSFIETEVDIEKLTEAWLCGYRKIRPVAEIDALMIPDFVILRRILMTAWIASHPETPTAQMLRETFTAGTVSLAGRWLKNVRNQCRD